MPPANSPSDTPGESVSRSPYLEQLGELAAPVPDFAATLMTQAETQANEDNVDFLRTTLSHLEDNHEPVMLRRTQATPLNSQASRATIQQSDTNGQRRGLAASVALLHNRRYTRAQLQEMDNSHDNMPPLRTSRRSPIRYQGWAPGTSDHETDDTQMTVGGLRALARVHSRSEQDPSTRRHIREQELREQRELRELRESGLYAGTGRGEEDQDNEMDWQSSRFMEDEILAVDSSLRTTALLQSVRRARFSPRTWNPPDTQERTTSGTERRERFHPRLAREHELRSLDNLRRGIASDLHRVRQTEDSSSEASRWLEEAIKYLERLRFCDSYSDRILWAAESGFISGEHFAHNHEDFILDTTVISQPKPTSFLRVGSVFSGSQHATASAPIPTYHLTHSSRRSGERGTRASGSSTTGAQGRSLWINNVISRTANETGDDSWPVKVTINSVNYDSMTLTGTMEAFNVPNKATPAAESSITTYLEGEIIDFNQYTLETKSFNADSGVDSTYWRKLEPFKNLTDDEVVSHLVSTKWLCEELGQKWILMRWKEKCFVTPSDAQLGLTISGFYYVAMRRADGRVEGLYYDPLSSPYQHLSLMPERRMFPSYKFA